MAKAQFIMEKSSGKLRFCGEQQESLYHAWASGLLDGTVIDVTLTKHRHPKTLAQLGYYFAVLMPFAVQELRNQGHDELFEVSVGDLKTGVETNTDTVDILFKTLFRSYKSMERIPLKRNMNDEEMGELIDFTLAWLAKNLGAIAPLPNKKEQE